MTIFDLLDNSHSLKVLTALFVIPKLKKPNKNSKLSNNYKKHWQDFEKYIKREKLSKFLIHKYVQVNSRRIFWDKTNVESSR